MHSEFEQLYQRHRQGLFTLALSVTGDAESAEDAVHEAFARMLRKGDLPEDDPVAYVFGAVRNAAIDQLRRRGARPAKSLSIFAAPPADSQDAGPPQRMMDRERDMYLQQAIDQLPDAQKQAVLMKIYGGLTFDQIARALDEPLSTVSSRYKRALEKVRQSVENLV